MEAVKCPSGWYDPPAEEIEYCHSCRRELPCLCPKCSICGERSCKYEDCGINELEQAEERDRQLIQAESIHEEERRDNA